jgi:hypothetical protein
MNYYLVECKFGHVGRNKYIPLNIPVSAYSIKEASKKAKSFRGVKTDHKDWCLKEPKEISFEIYEKKLYEFKNDIYFEKKTRSRLILFKDRLMDEPNYSRLNGLKTNRKKYKKTRDIKVVNFKLRKTKILIDSFLQDYDYKSIIKGEYKNAFTTQVNI